MKKFKFIFIALLTISLSCEDFEEMNVNPNEPIEVSYEVLLPAAIRTAVNTVTLESFLIANNAAQLTAKSFRTEVDEYKWNAFPTVWEGLYESLKDIKAVENIAIESENKQLEGVAVVLRSWVFSNITNAYGNVPYFEAIKGANGNITPKYTAQDSIYTDLLSELKRASELLEDNASIGGDILLDGNTAAWLKFSNSLRLRLLMTAGNQIPDAGQQFAAIVTDGNYITTNSDNVALQYLSAFPNQFPTVPLKTGDFDAVEFSNTSLNAMQANNDPRLARYARPDGDDYTIVDLVSNFSGLNNGSDDQDLCNRSRGSRLGSQYFQDPEETLVGAPTFAQPQGLIITHSEVQFLLAEATEKGWITGTDVATYYKAGIEASMDYYSVDYASFGFTDFEDYYTNSGVSYSEKADIWEQKWLSLFFVGLEPYFEVRRWYNEVGFDGIPFLEASCDNKNSNKLPLRFQYPGEEQSLNQTNYETALEAYDNKDDINAKMWILQ